MRTKLSIFGLLSFALFAAACDPVVTHYASTNPINGDLQGRPEGYLLVLASHDEQYVVKFGQNKAAVERVTKTYGVGNKTTVHEFKCGAFVTNQQYTAVQDRPSGWKQVGGLVLRGRASERLDVNSNLGFNSNGFSNEAVVTFETNGWTLKKVFPGTKLETIKYRGFCDQN